MTFGREELLAIEKLKLRVRQLEADRSEPVAIVGASCRLPGADSPEALWRLLAAGGDAITSLPALDGSVMACGVVDEAESFDAEFFRMSRREVLRMDIRQRFALEASWEALERAGIPASALEGSRVGVYLGVSGLSPLAEAEADTHDITGSLPAVVAGRVSYFLGLRGPAMSIDTACSSSLVAVHLACKALRSRECVVALAGGVGVLPRSRREQESWLQVGHLGKAGRCRTFDAAADGIVGSDGAVMLVLKRFGAAVKDGDRILAVIRGSALNHDGRAQGLTVPSGLAQEELLRRALADARVEAGKVDYLECHGTGTPLGDPIEVQAIGKVFGEGGRPSPPLVLGSIKSNIGHTDAAAGVAGVLKVVLALEHGVIPRTLHFETPNPHIPWDALPVAVAAEPVAWPRNGSARIAGISSFGISGTNAHVIVEDGPATSGAPATSSVRAAELVVLSARGSTALDRVAARLGEQLDAHPEQALGDLAYSLATTRTHHDHRLALAVRTREQLRQAVSVAARGETPDGGVRAQTRKGKTAWLFTGQGSQTLGMGRELAAAWPAFRGALDGACAALDPHLDRPLRDVMWAAPGTEAAAQLDQTAYTQPALFAFQVALAALWRSWGVEPDLLAGHSIGEVSAACVAEVFSLEDAARLVAARGRLMQALPAGGAMYAIAAAESVVRDAIEPHVACVSIAAINGPASVVISGAGAAVVQVAEAFQARGVKTTRLEVSHAFHSALMDDMLEGFHRVTASVAYRAPARVLVSNLTGKLAGPEIATPAYWVRHVREAVRFADGVRVLDEAGAIRFVELGPKPTVLGLVAACLPERPDGPALIASLRPRRSEPIAVLEALAGYHAHGGSIAFSGVFPQGGRRLALPTYPWQRQRYAVEAAVVHGRAGEPTGHPLLGARVSFAGGATVYESMLSRAEHGWLYDHQVAGTAIVPGAGLVELVRAAAEHRFDEPASVASLVLQTPLALPPSGARRVQVVVSDDGERTEASVYSQPQHGGAAWTLHATAEVRRAPVVPVASLDLAAVRRRCADPVDVSQLYETFAATGIEHGPAFRGLEAVWRGGDEALAEVALPDSTGGAERFGVHPALLDAAFQATLVGLGPVEGLRLPFAMDHFVVHEPGARRAFAWVRRSGVAGGADGASVDVTLTDGDGRVLVVLDGLHGRRADRLASPAPGHAEVIANGRYRLDWAKTASPEAAPSSGRWVVVAPDGDPTAHAVAQRLASSGVASCRRVDPRHLDEALPADHVVCLWNDPGAPHDAAEADAVLHLAIAGLAVAQRVLREDVPPRLWWVTERGAVVTGRDAPSIASCSLWGLGRTVMQELPELACTLVDLPRSLDGATADVLLRELAGGDDEREVAWRDGQRHVARIVRASALDVSPPVWTANGTVLVTGGLGALGGHVARWLAGRGIRHLILTGRRGADTPGAAALVAELAALGATVSVVAADAADRPALARVIAGIDPQAPLRGVVHAAGVLDDGVLAEQTEERFARVLGPKVEGALHLDALTRELDLDFFLLFSSTAGTFGAAGQAPYAAANAALDALAARRRVEGRPAQSLAWGAWSEGGMASGLSGVQMARLEQLGMTALSPAQGIALLESVFGRPEAQLVLLPLDLATIKKAFGGAVPPLWRTLVRTPLRSSAERGAWGTSLGQLPPSRRAGAVLDVVRAEIARVFALAGPNEVAADRPLQELGLDSLMAVELRNALGKRTGTTLSATLVFDHPSPAAIAKHLLDHVLTAPAPRVAAVTTARPSDEPVAIVGLGCRYPGGVNDPASFWRLLRDGIDGVIEVPPERWDIDALYDPDPDAAGKTTTRCGGFLSNIDRFDPAFFGIPPREAAAMDPQQRLLLETSWEALEHAGIAPDGLGGSSTGVFVGHMYAEYASLAGNLEQFDGFVGIGTAPSVAAGRISYTLGLTGPSMTVDTACSSSLVTTHLACQALRRGECSLALAGGVTVMLLPAVFVEFSRLRGLSPDGRCKSFSSGANGVGWGEGCGMLVLERLSDARRNGHRILALVRGSAVNQDGRSNGLTAPNGPSQEAVIRSALAQAGVRPSEVQYVECHGTGTSLGDPIEVRALGAVIGDGRDGERPVVIGSVKSNLAHTQAAAGAAGIMKVVLALQNGVIPKNLHFDGPNPHIPWDELPVRVAAEAIPWPRNGVRRIAGVSSFGVSGTNAHVVIEEAPAAEPRPTSSARSPALVVVSARTPAALDEAAARLRAHLAADPEPSLRDIAFSLAIRSRHEHRLAFPVATRDELAAALDGASRGETPKGCTRARLRWGKTAWLFTGQGSQVLGMGRGLAETWPAFRVAIEAAFEAIDRHLDRHLDRPLREVMWAGAASPAANLLNETAYTQPALFAFEIALAALWRSWGAEPDFVAGHSIGELSAAYVAGIFSLEDAARLVTARGQLMQRLPRGGAMIAIAASEAEVSAAVEPHAERVAVAAINGPRSVVVSGAEVDVEAIARRFADQGARTKRLDVSHPFHSPWMEPMLAEFRRVAESVTYRTPERPLVSNVTGTLVDSAILEPAYWVRHVREAVRFADGVTALHREGVTRFLEIGPASTLLGLVPGCLPDEDGAAGPALHASLRADRPEPAAVLEAAGAYWADGGVLDATALCPDGQLVDLPAYPWQRQRHWFADGNKPSRVGDSTEHPLLGLHVALAGSRTVYESTMSRREPPWLSDHQVAGQVVVPGAALAELVRAAAEHRLAEPAEVTSLVFQAPLVLPERGARRVQLIWSEDGERPEVSVYSQPEGAAAGATWTLHATAEARRTDDVEPAPVDLSALRRRCTTSVDVETVYGAASGAGLAYGPAFRGLTALWRGPAEALAELRLPETVEDAERYGVHPALLDAAFQAIAGLEGGDGAHLPFAIDAVRVHQLGARSALAHVRRNEVRDGGATLDVTLTDARGHVLVEVAGLRVRRADAAGIRAAATETSAASHYRIEWARATAADGGLPGGLAGGLAGGPPGGRWLVVAPAGDALAAALDDRLRATGGASRRVEASGLRDALPAEQVVCVWPAGVDEAVVATAAEALAVTQQLARAAEPPRRLWWVTEGATAIAAGDVPSVGLSSLWGLGRTVAQELPELGLALVDVGRGAGVRAVDAVLHELGSRDDEREVGWRDGQRHVPRLVRAVETAARARELRTDGTVLITGGLGGLGVEVARWFAARGVRHLVLTGRRGNATPGATQTVSELEKLGARVTVAAVDVSDRRGLAEVLAGVGEAAPLRGVVHAAGVLDDGVIAEQTTERFARVLAPKVLGALHLDALTRQADLDVFVVFSSISGTLGAAGQSSYAAANVALDAVASRRRAAGLAGQSLAWGAWAGVGMAAGLDGVHRSRLARRGMPAFTVAAGIAAFASALARPDPQLVLVPLDLRAAARSLGTNVPPLFRRLVRVPRRASAATPAWAHELASVPPERRHDAVLDVVRVEIARVLVIDPANVGSERPLQELGLDSLMAVELRNALGKRAGATLPATLAFDYPTPAAIATYVLGKVLRLAEPAAPSATGAPPAADVLTLATMVELSDDDAVARLQAEISAASSALDDDEG